MHLTVVTLATGRIDFFVDKTPELQQHIMSLVGIFINGTPIISYTLHPGVNNQFNVNVSIIHPFWITKFIGGNANVANNALTAEDGVTDNGITAWNRYICCS